MKRDFTKCDDFGKYERPSIIKTSEEFNLFHDQIKEDNPEWFPKFQNLLTLYKEKDSRALHNILEDGNLHHQAITYVEGLADGLNDCLLMDIAGLLKYMTMAQRNRVADWYVENLVGKG